MQVVSLVPVLALVASSVASPLFWGDKPEPKPVLSALPFPFPNATQIIGNTASAVESVVTEIVEPVNSGKVIVVATEEIIDPTTTVEVGATITLDPKAIVGKREDGGDETQEEQPREEEHSDEKPEENSEEPAVDEPQQQPQQEEPASDEPQQQPQQEEPASDEPQQQPQQEEPASDESEPQPQQEEVSEDNSQQEESSEQIPSSTVPPEPGFTPHYETFQTLEPTKTEEDIPAQYITDRPDILFHYGAYLDNFHYPQHAVSLARKVSSDIAAARATPTYNAKSLLSGVFRDVPQPTGHSFESLIDETRDGKKIVNDLHDIIIVPFLNH